MTNSAARERLQRALVDLSRTGSAGRRVGRRPIDGQPPRHGADAGAGGAGPVPADQPGRSEGRRGRAGAPVEPPVDAGAGAGSRPEGAVADGPALPGAAAAPGDLADLVARLDRIEEQLSALVRPPDASRESFEEWVRLGYWAHLRFGEFLRLRRSGMI